jgi:replication factor C subunit 3/5
MFLIDKYRGINAKNIFYNISINQILDKILDVKIDANNFDMNAFLTNKNLNNFPHLLINGQVGCGKDMLVDLILTRLFDDSIYKLEDIEYTISGYGNNKTHVILKQSKYHIIIEPNSSGFDKYLIQEVVKKYAQTQTIKFIQMKRDFKIVIINKMDNLSFLAQASLRRTMEKYVDSCKFILLCDQMSKVIEPLKSRCLNINVPLPKESDIVKIVLNIAKTENIKLKPRQLKMILENSENKIERSIWLLDMVKYKVDPINYWKVYILKIVHLSKDVHPKTDCKALYNILVRIRKIFYDIFITNIEPRVIIKELMFNFIEEYKDFNLINDIVEITSKYELRLLFGKRYIIHLEAYINSILYLILQTRKKVNITTNNLTLAS